MDRPSILFSSLSPYSLTRHEQKRLTQYFFLLSALLFILFIMQQQRFESTVAGLLITTAAILPSLIWIRGYVLGLPIFPIFAATFISTYASPLVFEHPVASLYTASEHLIAGFKITGMLALATLSWFLIARRKPRIPEVYRALKPEGATTLFLIILYFAFIYQVLLNNGTFWMIPTGLHSILRALAYGLNWVALFYLSYAWGQRTLSQSQRVLFLIGLIIYISITASSLILAQAIWNCIIALMGFALGARKLPISLITVSFLFFSVLHYGKGQMRQDFWHGNATPLELWDYPGFFVNWFTYSISTMTSPTEPDMLYSEILEDKSPASLLERASLAHIFLLAQQKTAEGLPYLRGKTYTNIPEQLIPRILFPSKSTPLRGTRMLNIHFGLQTAHTATTYSISWGIINESYANFGLTGLLFFGILVGISLAYATLLCSFTPVLSARAFAGVIIMGVVSKTEITTGTMIVSLFHNLAVLGVFAYIVMKPFSLTHIVETSGTEQ